MNLIQRFIPEDKKPKYDVNGKTVTFKMNPEYITIHETANTGNKANAEAHARLQEKGNSRKASWHIQVDDTQAIQSLPFNECAIHAGDGENGKGNRSSIAIEICVNADGDFEKAVINAAKVTAKLMKQFNIPTHKVVPHNHWSGKNCPANLLKRWQYFIDLCVIERGKLDEKKNIQTVSSWAEDAHKWVVENNISDGTRPKEPVTREEVWSMLHRCFKKIT